MLNIGFITFSVPPTTSGITARTTEMRPIKLAFGSLGLYGFGMKYCYNHVKLPMKNFGWCSFDEKIEKNTLDSLNYLLFKNILFFENREILR